MQDKTELDSRSIDDIVTLVQHHAEDYGNYLMLYAEVEDGMVAPALFVDRGQSVNWVITDYALTPLIIKLWHAAPTDKKWVALSLVVDSGQFDINFYYTDDLPEGTDFAEREQTMIAAHFKDKPIIYPPFGLAADR